MLENGAPRRGEPHCRLTLGLHRNQCQFNTAVQLSALGGLDQWVEVWEKITRLFGQADGINLDRKQVMLNAFHHITRVAAS